MIDLEHIQALSEKAKEAMFGNAPYELDSREAFAVALVNAWPEIYKELVASRALVEGLRKMPIPFTWEEHRKKLIQAYEDSINPQDV